MAIHERAGTKALDSDLVNIPRLMAAYSSASVRPVTVVPL